MNVCFQTRIWAVAWLVLFIMGNTMLMHTICVIWLFSVVTIIKWSFFIIRQHTTHLSLLHSYLSTLPSFLDLVPSLKHAS